MLPHPMDNLVPPVPQRDPAKKNRDRKRDQASFQPEFRCPKRCGNCVRLCLQSGHGRRLLCKSIENVATSMLIV